MNARRAAPFVWLVAHTAVRMAPALLATSALAGCATPTAPLASAPGTGNLATPAGGDAGAPQPGARVAGNARTSGASSALPSAPLPGGEEPTPDKALPELRIEQLGMHVGGGSNSPEEKAPFHRALEQQFPAFLGCYRLADDPWTGGSFGIDIKIPRAGGALDRRATAHQNPRRWFSRLHGRRVRQSAVRKAESWADRHQLLDLVRARQRQAATLTHR